MTHNKPGPSKWEKIREDGASEIFSRWAGYPVIGASAVTDAYKEGFDAAIEKVVRPLEVELKMKHYDYQGSEIDRKYFEELSGKLKAKLEEAQAERNEEQYVNLNYREYAVRYFNEREALKAEVEELRNFHSMALNEKAYAWTELSRVRKVGGMR